jgi:hypothetical protein
MCLQFAFLLLTRVTAWLRLSQREEAWKTAAAPLKPLPEPVDLEQYRVRRQARAGGLINEYRLVV